VAPGAGVGATAFDESRRINQTLADLGPERRSHAADAAPGPARPASATPTSATAGRADLPADRRDFDRARDDRDAGIDALPDDGAIEPRELDARVRIDEGATVDDRTPVAGVRYDTPNYPRHDYELSPEYDASRVVSRHPADRPVDASDRVRDDAADVARRLGDAREWTGEERRVRYRTYPDEIGRPGEERR
jgi:hypothetical protein